MTDWARDDLALAHDLLTEAGMPRGDDHGFHSVAVRVGLLIDERNSLKDELDGLRERERIANRSGYAHIPDNALGDD